MDSKRGVGLLCAAAFLAALAFRLSGLGYGLPHTFNADEPHLVNLAVSFGRGSLKPQFFKYPTLYPTVLFFSYILYFLWWSVLGLRHKVGEFASLFAWQPTAFYLIGRALSAAYSLGVCAVLWKAEREENKDAIPWAALLLAFSPAIIESAHAVKPDCQMLFFGAMAWYFALRIFREGRRLWYWACGACLGLAFSSQYTAVAAFSLLPLAHVLSRKRGSLSWLFEGFLASAGGFLLGTPYALLDFSRFMASMRDHSDLAKIRAPNQPPILWSVFLNVWNFAGEGGLAGPALLAGLWAAGKRDPRRAALLAGPVVCYIILLGSYWDGGWPRYLFAAYPGLALLAGEGLSLIPRKRRMLTALAGLAALGPGLYGSWAFDRGVNLPDTRTLATDWVAGHVPQGSVLLMDAPHASPRLAMIKEQVEELRRQTELAGSPRSRLFKAMAAAHPGGGYRIYRLKRSAVDLSSNPLHHALSEADSALLDMTQGLKPAREAGVRYVVTSSFGTNLARAPELALFFSELCAQASVAAQFLPEPGVTAGPVLRVYELGRPASSVLDRDVPIQYSSDSGRPISYTRKRL